MLHTSTDGANDRFEIGRVACEVELLELGANLRQEYIVILEKVFVGLVGGSISRASQLIANHAR